MWKLTTSIIAVLVLWPWQGFAQCTPTTTANSFINPLEGGWPRANIAQGFGRKVDDPLLKEDSGWPPRVPYNGYHLAYDIFAPSYTKEFAPASGCIAYASVIDGVGYVVVIQYNLPPGDADGLSVSSVMYHMLRPGTDGGKAWAVGAAVSQGDIVGFVSPFYKDHGSKPHQHFGVRKGPFQAGTDPRTGFWHYPGYTSICERDASNNCTLIPNPTDPKKKIKKTDPNRNNPVHEVIIAEWFNPYEFLNRHSPTSQSKRILIYGPSLASSTPNEQTLASGLGYVVTVAGASQWAGMSTSQFAAFDAIVFPDPTCVTGTQLLATAEANKALWSAAVTGPKLVLGTDPQFHRFTGQAQQLMLDGVKFAAAGPGTGLYLALSCYYSPTPSKTPVTVLSQFGTFLVETQNGCPSTINIVAPSNPAMAGLTNAGLSNWSCSMHEWFNQFPISWSALAVDVTIGFPRTYVISDR